MTHEALNSVDVAIVGGGVVGSAIAYFLCADEVFDGRVVVIEKDPSYDACSTTRSVGGIRQQFSTPENIRMSLFAAEFIEQVDEFLTVDGEAPSLTFVENGYLVLATEAGLATLQLNYEVQRDSGADVALLSTAQLAERFPWLCVDDLAGGSLGLSGEGWIDPHSLLHGFRRKAESLGAVFLQDEVVGLHKANSVIRSVQLASGMCIDCGTVVNAAGAHAAEVALLAGVELPVRPRKRQVFVFACQDRPTSCPLVVDPTGLYFRPEGEHFICGISPAMDDDPDSWNLDVDYEFFEQRLWPLLAHRVPAFEACKCISAWAGSYAFNLFDQNAIIGRHSEIENFIFANGFSGHGLQQGPAVGRAVSELITFGAYRSLDLSRLGFDRFAANRPLRELNVV